MRLVNSKYKNFIWNQLHDIINLRRHYFRNPNNKYSMTNMCERGVLQEFVLPLPEGYSSLCCLANPPLFITVPTN